MTVAYIVLKKIKAGSRDVTNLSQYLWQILQCVLFYLLGRLNMLFSVNNALANYGLRGRFWLHSADVEICDKISSSALWKSVCLDQGIVSLINREQVFLCAC